MKKLNKLFLAAGSVAAVAAPVAAVVSCGTNAGISTAMGVQLHTSKEADVWFVADGGSVQDKSFNESGLSAVAKFGNENNKTYNFYQPTGNNLISGYDQATRSGAKVVLGAGFAHGDNGADAGPAGKAFTGKVPFIGIDASLEHSVNKANMVSILYNTQEAGYLAGLYAIDYITKHKDEFTADSKGMYQVATYGGIAFPTVTSWMDGFQMAIAKKGTAANVEMIYVNGTSASDADFSKGFGLDASQNGPQATTISQKLLEKGADIIFPVAGAQTQLTIREIQRQRAKAKVIGVDGDLKKALNNSPYVIGSALKNIQQDSIEALSAFFATDHKNWTDNFAGHVKVGHIGFIDDKSQPTSLTIDSTTLAEINATSTNHVFGKVGETAQMGNWSTIVDKAL